MYGDVVLGIDHCPFEDRLEIAKQTSGYELDTELGRRPLRADRRHQGDRRGRARAAFPETSRTRSGRDRRGVRLVDDAARGHLPPPHDIDNHWGTAVNVQAMVFGNRGERSATGVAFTRDPSTGEKRY